MHIVLNLIALTQFQALETKRTSKRNFEDGSICSISILHCFFDIDLCDVDHPLLGMPSADKFMILIMLVDWIYSHFWWVGDVLLNYAELK